MWRIFICILFVITNVSCIFSKSVFPTENESRIERDYKHQFQPAYRPKVGSPYREEYAEAEYPNSYRQDLLGNWRNNGEALEPNWRDGDSVPSGPLRTTATISNSRNKRPPSRFRNNYESETNGERMDHNRSLSEVKSQIDSDSAREEDVSGSYELNFEKFISTTDNLPTERDDEHSHRNGYNNNSNNKDNLERRSNSGRQHSRPGYEFGIRSHEDHLEDSSKINWNPYGNKNTGDKYKDEYARGSLDNSYGVNPKDNSQIITRHSENFQDHPNEYDLNEDEYEKPRPRKRKPPRINEFLETDTSYQEFQSDRSSSFSGSVGGEKDPSGRDKINSKSYRRPYLSRNRDNGSGAGTKIGKTMENLGKSSENTDLKTLLKMQNGLSLSEILQQKNLSLSDLLKGEANAINVLKSTNENSEGEKRFDSERDRDTVNHPAPVNIMNSKKIINLDRPELKERLSESSTPSTGTSVVTDDVQNIAEDEDKRTGSVAKERPMSEMTEDDEIMEFSDFTVKRSESTTPARFEPSTLKPGDTLKAAYPTEESTVDLNDTDSMLSIEHDIMTMTEETATNGPNVSDYSSTNRYDSADNNLRSMEQTANNLSFRKNAADYAESESGYQNDGTNENKTFAGKESIISNDYSEDPSKSPFANGETRENGSSGILVPFEKEEDRRNVASDRKKYEEIVSEVEPEARAEISELFSSGSSAERLEKLLRSRNMSLEELIALRQRGSSKVHLAEVFKSREQEKRITADSQGTEGNRNGSVEEEAREEIQRGDREGLRETHILLRTNDDSRSNSNITLTDGMQMETEDTLTRMANRDYEYLSKEKSNPAIEPKLEETIETLKPKIKPIAEDTSTEVNLKDFLRNFDLTTTFDSLPFSKHIQTDSEGSSYYTSITEVKLPTHAMIPKRNDDPVRSNEYPKINRSTLTEIGRVEEILNDDLRSISKIYRPDYEDSRNKTLSKVKPSIIASGAILGVTIVVFLAIFIACRIRQKQRFTYRKSFAKAVFQGPVMSARKLSNTSSLNSIMVNVVATSTAKRSNKNQLDPNDEDFDAKTDIEDDSLDANDSWETIPDFMK